MAVADSYDEKQSFLRSFATIAGAAKTFAEAYARKAEQPSYVININHDGNVHTAADISNAVKRVLNQGRPQDR